MMHTATHSRSRTTALTTPQRQALRERAQRDPVWWVERVLGAPLWAKQRVILDAVRDTERVAVRSAHSCGKTYVAARAALWFLYTHAPSLVITTAPTFRQVRSVLWQEIRRAYHQSLMPLGGTLLETELRLGDGWFALGVATDQPEAMQGLKAPHVLVTLDEAQGVAPNIWTASESLLACAHPRLLAIGNPTDPLGPFRDLFRDPRAAKLHISALETPNVVEGRVVIPGLVTREWIEDKRTRWGEASALWQARVLGDFPDAATDALIPLAWVESAFARTLEPMAPHTLGVDVAFQGDDTTVIVERHGPVARIHTVRHGNDPMEVSGWICHALDETGATAAYIDAIGLGAGIVARLQELGRPAVGVNVGDRAHDNEQFANRRAEVFYGLRERFQQGDIAVAPDDELARDLTVLSYKRTSRGQLLLIAKDELKRRGLPSPDRADALALAFAAPAAVPDFAAAFRLI